MRAIQKMVARELYYQKRVYDMDYKQAILYAIKYIAHSSCRKDLILRKYNLKSF